MAGVLIRRSYEDTGMQRCGRMSHEDRYGSDTATYQGMPRAPEARRRYGMDSLAELPERTSPSDPLTSDF